MAAGTHAPFWARLDVGGVDLSLCEPQGEAVSYYLRPGARASSDPLPHIGCDERLEAAPRPVRERSGFGPLSEKEAGDHFASGRFKLRGHRYLTRSLLLLTAPAHPLDRAL